MNDFSELEGELKKLRPARTSPDLVARIERALAESPVEIPTAGVLPKKSSFRLNWLSLGLGVAAAATFLLLARLDVDRAPQKSQTVGVVTPAPSRALPAATSPELVPEGLTRVVYSTQDEGLHFPGGAAEPVRRVRSRTRETLQWRNPDTGASLRVSYPSEEVMFIPVSGQ
jgi:hypothetical protein